MLSALPWRERRHWKGGADAVWSCRVGAGSEGIPRWCFSVKLEEGSLLSQKEAVMHQKFEKKKIAQGLKGSSQEVVWSCGEEGLFAGESWGHTAVCLTSVVPDCSCHVQEADESFFQDLPEISRKDRKARVVKLSAVVSPDDECWIPCR